MIIAGYEYKGEKPFENVYLTGIVRDKQRRKMSKSLGNSPDPLDLIKDHGADAVRTGMLFSSPAGNDLLFDIKLVEQGQGFATKIWNAYRLLTDVWEVKPGTNDDNKLPIDWINSRINQVLTEIEDHFAKFRISDALMSIYKLVKEDLCNNYLEFIKPRYGEKIDQGTYDATLEIFEKAMKLTHPFMPFISEEIWHQINDRDDKDALIVASWPKAGAFDLDLIGEFETINELITAIRNTRNAKGMKKLDPIELKIRCKDREKYSRYNNLLSRIAILSSVEFVDDQPNNCASFIVGTDEFFIPLGENVDLEAEKEKLMSDLSYQQGFLKSVMKKLENERFVQNAPAKVIEIERKKQADAEVKIKALEASIKQLG